MLITRETTAAQVRRYAAASDRDGLIAFCKLNDPNGTWADEDCDREGITRSTREGLLEIVEEWCEDMESAERYDRERGKNSLVQRTGLPVFEQCPCCGEWGPVGHVSDVGPHDCEFCREETP